MIKDNGNIEEATVYDVTVFLNELYESKSEERQAREDLDEVIKIK